MFKTPQRCSENITVFFPTCTSSKKLIFSFPPVKTRLNVEAIANFCFQKLLLPAWLQTPTELYVSVPVTVCITLSLQTSLTLLSIQPLLQTLSPMLEGKRNHRTQDSCILNTGVRSHHIKEQKGSRYKNAKSLFTATKRQVLFGSISSKT